MTRICFIFTDIGLLIYSWKHVLGLHATKRWMMCFFCCGLDSDRRLLSKDTSSLTVKGKGFISSKWCYHCTYNRLIFGTVYSRRCTWALETKIAHIIMCLSRVLSATKIMIHFESHARGIDDSNSGLVGLVLLSFVKISVQRFQVSCSKET